MRRLVGCALASCVVGLLLAGPAGAWSWPVAGEVLRPFALGANAYAAGQHRGVDVAGSAGEQVLAPVGGTVTFAGSVPTHGRVVTVLTGDGLSVTLAHLGAIGVVKGSQVREGEVLGAAGSSGEPEHPGAYVHLGVRVAAEPQGYLDPTRFLPPRAVAPPSVQPAAGDAAPAPAPDAPPAPASDPSPADGGSAAPIDPGASGSTATPSAQVPTPAPAPPVPTPSPSPGSPPVASSIAPTSSVGTTVVPTPAPAGRDPAAASATGTAPAFVGVGGTAFDSAADAAASAGRSAGDGAALRRVQPRPAGAWPEPRARSSSVGVASPDATRPLRVAVPDRVVEQSPARVDGMRPVASAGAVGGPVSRPAIVDRGPAPSDAIGVPGPATRRSALVPEAVAGPVGAQPGTGSTHLRMMAGALAASLLALALVLVVVAARRAATTPSGGLLARA